MEKFISMRVFRHGVCMLNQCIFLTLIAALLCALMCDQSIWPSYGQRRFFIKLVILPTFFLQAVSFLLYPIAQLHVLAFWVFGGLKQIEYVRIREKIICFSIRISIKSFAAFAINIVLFLCSDVYFAT